MIMASFSGLLKTLLIIFGIFLLLRIILRYLGPLLMRYFIRKITKKAKEKFRSTNSDFTSKKEIGKTTIDFTPENDYKTNKDSGEYIDYEEID